MSQMERNESNPCNNIPSLAFSMLRQAMMIKYLPVLANAMEAAKPNPDEAPVMHTIFRRPTLRPPRNLGASFSWGKYSCSGNSVRSNTLICRDVLEDDEEEDDGVAVLPMLSLLTRGALLLCVCCRCKAGVKAEHGTASRETRASSLIIMVRWWLGCFLEFDG
jgi:hypothetical protein